jgi:diguanylate cyclase (GGDEF)-like protein
MIARIAKSATIAVKAAIFGFEKSFRYGETIDSILGYIDDLTQLPNRRAFERDIVNIDRSNSLIMIDIDNFKSINDSKGHVFGDIILKRLAHIMRKSVGPHGTIYRLGGDEFIIVVTAVHVVSVCIGIRAQLRKEDSFTISQGVVGCLDRTKNRDVVDLADKALYASKTNGKNRITFCN